MSASIAMPFTVNRRRPSKRRFEDSIEIKLA
jgi:hypothetical protein